MFFSSVTCLSAISNRNKREREKKVVICLFAAIASCITRLMHTTVIAFHVQCIHMFCKIIQMSFVVFLFPILRCCDVNERTKYKKRQISFNRKQFSCFVRCMNYDYVKRRKLLLLENLCFVSRVFIDRETLKGHENEASFENKLYRFPLFGK